MCSVSRHDDCSGLRLTDIRSSHRSNEQSRSRRIQHRAEKFVGRGKLRRSSSVPKIQNASSRFAGGTGLRKGDTRCRESQQRRIREPDDLIVHSNTTEGHFGIFKRDEGVFTSMPARSTFSVTFMEFDFRHRYRVALGVNDMGRTEAVLRDIVGKRLTYQDSSAARV